jgi:hypothetical protein
VYNVLHTSAFAKSIFPGDRSGLAKRQMPLKMPMLEWAGKVFVKKQNYLKMVGII